MREAFAELNYSDAMIDEQLKNMFSQLDRPSQPLRKGLLSFFAPASDFVLHNADQNGYISLYASIVGGEFATQCFKDDPDISRDLRRIGQPILVKTSIPIQSCTHRSCENNRCRVNEQILANAVRLSEHQKYDEIVFLLQTEKPLSPASILGVDRIEL